MLLKAFRLFVSSTFKDFTQERELLQDKVFLALHAYCAARGYQFHAVDLRWGVNEEAQLDQRTAEICLGEVAAAKGYPAPNLLILIGDRYGWVPLPYTIARDEFDAIVTWLTERGETGVVDDLLAAYQLDENAAVERGLVGTKVAGEQLIAAYTLRSRDDEISAFAPPDEWEKLEAWLRNALQNAADHLLKMDQIDEAGHQKYFLSLTEQEIIRGIPGYGRGDVRHAADKSPPPHSAGPQAIAWIREPPASPALAPEPRINALKVGLRRILPADCILTDRATAGADGWFDEAYLDRFATTIESNLKAAIDRHIAQVEAQEHAPDAELQNERATHRAFAEQRRHIIGRKGNVADIDQYMRGSSTHPLVVHGRSGSGKSALLAHVTTGGALPGSVQHPPVVYRFIGASATSTDQRAMLVSLIDDLAQHGILQKPEAWEDDGNKFVAQVRELLSTIEKPVVIVLDALDQLRKPYRPGWLPANLPTGAKVIISVLDDEAFAADSGICRGLRQRLPENAFLAIEPLGAAHGHDILAALEHAARRRLQPAQREYIVGQFMNGGASPLYLRIAFEIARGWRSTDAVGPGGRELAADTSALIAQLVAELSSVQHHEPLLVSRVLGYITASKDGLSAAELVDVLSRDAEVMQAISSERHGARTSKLPVSVWVRLHRHLEAMLVEKRVDDQPLLQYFHRQLAEVVRERFYVGSQAELHAALATHFDSPIDRTFSTTSESGSSIYSSRSLSELPYQLFQSGSRFRLDEILMAPEWMQQKLDNSGPQPLIADYEDFGRGSIQSLIGRTLRLTSGIMTRDPRQLLPQLLARLTTKSDPAAPNFLADARSKLPLPAILTLRPSLTGAGSETARLEGHSGGVVSLTVLTDGRLASGSHDKTVRLWDPRTGAEAAMLAGHTGTVNRLAELPGGRLASAADDGMVCVWDLYTGAELARINTAPLPALAALRDGRLVTGARDGVLQLWDPSTGAELSRMKGHRHSISWLGMLADGRLASASRDGVRLWEPGTGAEIGHIEIDVEALKVLPDGRLAARPFGEKGMLELWDLRTCAVTARLDCQTFLVRAVAMLADGQLATGGINGTVLLWNPRAAVVTGRLEGHADYIGALAALPDGRFASGSGDNTIRLWDPSDVVQIERSGSTGQLHPVAGLAVLVDGRVASSSTGVLRLWDTNTGAETAHLEAEPPAGTLTVLRDSRLAWGSSAGIVQLWDPRSGDKSDRLQYHEKLVGPAPAFDVHAVSALAVLRHNRLAWSMRNGAVCVWDLQNGAEVTRFKTEPPMAMAALTDGRLATGAANCVRLWDPQTGSDAGRLECDTGYITALAVLPDGRLATGSSEGTVLLLDSGTGDKIECRPGSGGAITSVAVLSDGRLASSSLDKSIRIWNPITASQNCCLEVDARVHRLTSLPDGRLVAGDEMGRLHWLEIVD